MVFDMTDLTLIAAVFKHVGLNKDLFDIIISYLSDKMCIIWWMYI